MTTPIEPRIPLFETRREQALPHLDERQLNDLMHFGERRSYAAGELLFSEGERHVGMFVVLGGRVEILRHTLAGEERLVIYDRGHFTGDIGLLAGRGAVASGRAYEDSEVLVIDEPSLHRLVVTHAELSELIMRAYILRRMAMLEASTAPITLIGSRLAVETHRLRNFLTSNGQPHSYLDLAEDAETTTVLERFGVTEDELPVAITGNGEVLRSPTIRALADAIGLSPEPLDG